MNVLSMLIGAGLVMLGVCTSALADRIRGVRIVRDARPRAAAKSEPGITTPAHTRLRNDVVDALVQSGFRPLRAKQAVEECKGSEQASLESWIRAALKIANAGAA